MFKPMLASPVNMATLRFPIVASAKLDGIRAIVMGGVVYSRNMKPIPNAHVQSLFGGFEHYDGELIMGDPTAEDCYRKTMSAVMSRDGKPNVDFHVFDHIARPTDRWTARSDLLLPGQNIVIVHQQVISSVAQLDEFEALMLDQGHEGIMIRNPSAPYKYGRSTANEGHLLKVKRFEDAEAIVVGYEERCHNANVATKDELGRTKRSSHQENLVGRGDLGALVCQYSDSPLKEGIVFNIGTGFDDSTRALLWAERDSLVGRIVKFKHFTIGAKEAPRFPVFLGFRSPLDM